jgi:lipopolysaccharide export LptBFGC system permease protein LptF
MSRTRKAVLWLVVIVVAVVVLFAWVFPWVEARTQDPAIGIASDRSSSVEAQRARTAR